MNETPLIPRGSEGWKTAKRSVNVKDSVNENDHSRPLGFLFSEHLLLFVSTPRAVKLFCYEMPEAGTRGGG